MVLQRNTKRSRSKRKKFSSFSTKEACEQLDIKNLLPWEQTIEPIIASDYFQERMARLQKHFDISSGKGSKQLLIDAVCEEALGGFDDLKIWKGMSLETETTEGIVDYLVADRKGYLDTPLLVCIVEAKKDNFEQGLDECLAILHACQWQNQQAGRLFDLFGIVSNGDAWVFYKLTPDRQAYETATYGLTSLQLLLGWLKYILEISQANLTQIPA
jgi:hypothetical protein